MFLRVRLKVGLAAILLSGSLLFSGCEKLPSPGMLITPPDSVDQNPRQPVNAETGSQETGSQKIWSDVPVQQLVREFLPAGARMLPSPPPALAMKSLTPIITYDFDRNGRPEILAAYRVSDINVGVLLLQEKSGKWEVVWQADVGYNLDHLQLADLTGDGRAEVLVGGTIGQSAGNGLGIYAWRNDGLAKITGIGYHRLEVLEPSGALGADRPAAALALWTKDTGDAYAVDVVRLSGGGLVPAEDLYAAYLPTVIEYYQQRVWEKPNVPVYWYYLAQARFKAGLAEKALESIEQGLALKETYPDRSQFLLIKGKALLALERYPGAAETFTEVLRLKDKVADDGERTASLSLPVRRKLSETRVEAFNGRAEAYQGMGENDLARKDREEARRLRLFTLADTDIQKLSLPFPRTEVREAWGLDNEYILIEHVQNRDCSFYLYSRPEAQAKLIVSFIEEAEYEDYADGKIWFRARGDGDSGGINFPYRLTYDLEKRKLRREGPLFLPVTEPVLMGKIAWRHVLTEVEAGENEILFTYRPREGEVLAGGNALPLTTVYYDEAQGELVLRLYSVESRVQGVGGTGSVQVEAVHPGESPDLPPDVVEELRQMRRSISPALFPTDRSSVRVRVKMPPNLFYSLKDVSSEGSEGLGYDTVATLALRFGPELKVQDD